MTQAPAPQLLIVEDDPSYAARLRKNLESAGFGVRHCETAESALALLTEARFDAVLTDIRLPGKSGLEMLDSVETTAGGAETEPPPIIVLTSVTSVDSAVEAMRKGAADYLTKDATRDEIVLRIRNVLGKARLADENVRLKRTLERYKEFDEIIGASDAVRRLKDQIKQIAPSSVTVLITGETGAGKELVARAVHNSSPLAGGPFVEVNCAALPDENLFLSELFGHEKGAFTGAIGRKRGQFELADGGTLFFDEVGELGPQAQARLLKAVETLTFTRLGGERPIKAQCRLLFATHRDLQEEVREGRFREDLYYRIAVFPMLTPPLRQRPEDIGPLARFFAAQFAEKHHLPACELTPEAIAALQGNPWPGNVRELRNVIERLSIRFSGRPVEMMTLHDLNFGEGAPAGAIVLPEGGIALEDVEQSLVVQALQRSDWNQRRAAQLLSISVDRMNARVKKFGITHPSWRVHKD